jgi:hypothetical protein
MRKYAALTALAIALITMLALAVSASLTPANAAATYCGVYFHSGGSWPICLCLWRCSVDAGTTTPLRPQGRPAIETKRQACEATCVNASEATRRKSRQ